MHQSINDFLENNKDFDESDIIKRDILNLYRDDIRKIDDHYQSRVLSIFDQIPSYLSKHEKRVILSEIAKQPYKKYSDSFFWLSDSMIANECFNTSDPNIGLMINEDRTYIKCYMGDTGLLVSHAFSENELIDNEIYKKILFDKLSINEGMLFENVIAQMLVSNGHKLFFYTHYNKIKHRNDIDIDFIISNKSKTNFKIYPIEVKSNKRYSITSLERFNEKFKKRIDVSYVIHPKNLKIENDIIYIPAYMTICL